MSTNLITLDTLLALIKGVPPKMRASLEKLEIKTVHDLLWHFPARYEDYSKITKIADLKPGESVTIRGEVRKITARKAWKSWMQIVEVLVTDETGGITLVWFNQPFIGKVLHEGVQANFAGKVFSNKTGIHLSNPSYEILHGTSVTTHTAGLIPVYPETRGLTSKGIRYLIKEFLDILPRLEDFLPDPVLTEHGLPSLDYALRHIHFPKNQEQITRARTRFAFEYVFLLQLNNLRSRAELAKEHAPVLAVDEAAGQAILKLLPFTLTESQQVSVSEIMTDLAKPTPMNRLLQGDVGSGKTAVAAIAAVTSAQSGHQTVFMAPTEVLARQHYHTLTTVFNKFDKGIAIITGSEARVYYGENLETKITKSKLIQEIESGKVSIIVGTHALIATTQKTKKSAQLKIRFPKLGLVIIDEQHRFGVSQRALLVGRGSTQKKTRIDAEEKFLYSDLSYKIRGALFSVRNALGVGFKESAYQKALENEFEILGIPFEKEKNIPIAYKGKQVGSYRPDFVIDEKILLELKASVMIGKLEERQLWDYLRGSKYKVGLLANFGATDLDIRRVVYDTARNPRTSGSSNLRESASLPHFLSMSATPIPRTLSLAIFGDLDVSTINELPKGRKQIITKIVDPINRPKAYGFIKQQIQAGRQAFFIYPRIEPSLEMGSDSLFTAANEKVSGEKTPVWNEAKAVKAEYERLAKTVFPNLRVAMLHGKMKPAEKTKVMADFKSGATDILVSTSVIEVGVDVPNSTIMVIEGAEHFGLAQLYQFRGRVGRGEHQSFCFLFTDSNSETTMARLNALIDAKNGFELAEKDLELRGPGQFLGDKQTGVADSAMQSLSNIQLVKAARDSAQRILTNDPQLTTHNLLKEKLDSLSRQVHME